MKLPRSKAPATLPVLWTCLAAAAVFEVLTVIETQDKPVRAVSPWQDDPYDAVVSVTQFAVPMLAAVILLRLPVWRAPGGPDRAQQTARAAGAMLALIALTLAAEWAAVAAGVGRPHWNARTSFLIAGLIVNSLLTTTAAALLWRGRAPRGSSRRWRHDWLGDVVLLGGRVPVLRRWARPEAAEWVRRHALTLFIAASALAAVGITGSQAVGERWTNPVLIAFALAVEFTAYLAFCLLTNAVAGFVARPPRSRARRTAETAFIVGAITTHLTIAFREALWPGPHSPTSVPLLTAFTFGVGLAVALATALLQAGQSRFRTSRPPGP